jgi:hypothetical protein
MNPFEWILGQISVRRKLPRYPVTKPCPICQGEGTFTRQGVVELCPCEKNADVVYQVGPDGVILPRRRAT